jgi:hypothetical protein
MAVIRMRIHTKSKARKWHTSSRKTSLGSQGTTPLRLLWEINSPDTEQQQQNTTDKTLNEALPAHHMPRGLGHQGEQAARRSQQVFASVSLQY